MKKILILISAVCLLASPAAARSRHGFHTHHPAPVKIFHHQQHHNIMPWAGLAIGLTGAAVATSILSDNEPVQYNNVTYINTQPEKKCFVLISKSSGSIVKKCLNISGGEEVVYIN